MMSTKEEKKVFKEKCEEAWRETENILHNIFGLHDSVQRQAMFKIIYEKTLERLLHAQNRG